ncbi:diguanylate cyclase domain-containing protein [Paenibacillus glycanilyticus]|uniref:GGDEF domain-containing protein n=1 Tax=Paenibacillus glycanilyticus TaxID=126569 RepID=A0ABQ6GLB7_9BACL|nr:diguanylate cyclase [Paenibacillus glycanilyticus]GLX70382.1 GGDEF domain-containing protein [Paenibacillus glycanilyticus]
MRRNASLLSDGGFLLLFIACFISIVFTSRDPNLYLQNIVLLNVAFLIAIITYFTAITAGLILNILFVFGYGTFTIYQTVVQGDVVTIQSYFWLIMTPVFTAITWMFTQASKLLQEENDALKKRNSSLATMDENTNLKNMLSFQKDATVFMALSDRYHIPLTLLVLNVKYWHELRRMIGEEQLNAAVYNISAISQTSIRANDSLYMLAQDNPMWGLLLFADRDGADIVMNRLRSRLAEINESEKSERNRFELNLKMGAYEYKAEETPTPLEWIDRARKELEYDV